MIDESVTRELLSRLLDWEDARVGFDAAISGIPPRYRGVKPAGAPHSPWQLLEHIRIAQHDILDFCVNPKYVELESMADLWPPSAKPPSARAWARTWAWTSTDTTCSPGPSCGPACTSGYG